MKTKNKKEKVIEVAPVDFSKLLAGDDEPKREGVEKTKRKTRRHKDDDSDPLVGGVAGALVGGVAGALLGGLLGVMAESFKSAADDDYDIDLDEDETSDEEDENDSEEDEDEDDDGDEDDEEDDDEEE